MDRSLKPNFFVIGAPKCGTTSLYYYLGQHPQIFVPRLKEPHYFSYNQESDSYYDVELISSKKDYLDLYKGAAGKLILADFSTSYYFHPEAVKAIQEFNPVAKLLLIIRNPIDRAISHYLMDVRLGYQRSSLNEILHDPYTYSEYYRQYVSRGMYHTILKRLGRAARSIKVMLFEDLRKQPEQFLSEILDCLYLEQVSIDYSRQHNTGKSARNQVIYRFRNSAVLSRLGKALPPVIKRLAYKVLLTSHVPTFKEERKVLRELFSEDVLSLCDFLSQDFTHWIE